MSTWDIEPEDWLRRFFFGRGGSRRWFGSGGNMPDQLDEMRRDGENAYKILYQYSRKTTFVL